jgi:hypothetical protein
LQYEQNNDNSGREESYYETARCHL